MAEFLALITDRQSLVDKAIAFLLVGPLVAALLIFAGLEYVNVAMANWHATIVANAEP